ncbi:Polygalacturonase 3 [Mycena chlorophos]|uniref:Polygalacturonase 3 n=1 Tax=Mycena chlorophos TaxID=658473 RepID=A0A8H6RXA9_MYCCL|nr:Polygalacturonase 3 [Mycena chlorophos]
MFPPEIWSLVAAHLPPSVCANLYSVNRQWFDIAMNIRYREISFAFLNQKMLHELTRLRDPAVARRVRTLHIHPYFVKEIFEQQRPTRQQSAQSLRGKFKLGGLFRDNHKRCARTGLTLFPMGPDELLRTLKEVLSGLPNVVQYDIAWNGLHTISTLPAPFLVAAFSPSILQLTLEISLEKAPELLAHTERLQGLEELDLFIRLDHLRSGAVYEQILVEHLAPAINRLHKTLQKFSLRLCEPMDVAPLFDSLRLFPFLESLSISIPLARPHLGHPSGLGNFLERHRNTLWSLTLRGSELSPDGLGAEDPLSEWINDALSYLSGPLKLGELELDLAVEAAALCLGRFARSVTSLTLTGRRLPYDDVDDLLNAVRRNVRGNQRLQRLRLGAVTLSPELIDLLAERLP